MIIYFSKKPDSRWTRFDRLIALRAQPVTRMKSIDSIILRPESSYIEIVFLGIENYGQSYAKIVTRNLPVSFTCQE